MKMWLIQGLRAQRNIEKHVDGGSAQLGLALNHFAIEGLNIFAVMFVHFTLESLAPLLSTPLPTYRSKAGFVTQMVVPKR